MLPPVLCPEGFYGLGSVAARTPTAANLTALLNGVAMRVECLDTIIQAVTLCPPPFPRCSRHDWTSSASPSKLHTRPVLKHSLLCCAAVTAMCQSCSPIRDLSLSWSFKGLPGICICFFWGGILPKQSFRGFFYMKKYSFQYNNKFQYIILHEAEHLNWYLFASD